MPMSCSRHASEYAECPRIPYPKDKEAFIKLFLETDPEKRAMQLAGHVPRKQCLKAKKRSDAEKIHAVLLDLDQKRYLDFSSKG